MTTVKEGLQLFEHLGVGGMGSRGFGRLKVLNLGQGDENDKPE
jgi:CRISPR/Cas system CSM-associated protein Csm3 (group 7 of RAMP superfamily)